MPNPYAGSSAAWVAQVPIPDETDIIDGLSEAKMAPAWKAIADRQAYLRRVQPQSYFYRGSGSPLWSNSNTGKSTTVGAYVDVPNVAIGDKVLIKAMMSIKYTGNPPSSINGNTLEIVVNGSGSNGVVGDGTDLYITGARANTIWSGLLGVEFNFELAGLWTSTVQGIARFALKFTALNLETLNVDSLLMAATRYGAP